MVNSIINLYGPVDNLTCFEHPKYGQRFNFLSDADVVLLGKRTIEKIVKSGYKQVVVAETGATPFAYVCEKLCEQQGLDVDWFSIKVPRKPNGNLYNLVGSYLSYYEKNELMNVDGSTRLEMLKKLCLSVNESDYYSEGLSLADVLENISNIKYKNVHRKISRLLNGTELGEVFRRPFIYLDEYADSGTTLKSAQAHFKFFSDNLDYKVGTYFTHIKDTARFDGLAFSLYDQDSELECYSFGAYPFENRVDLIGHYFYIDFDNHEKVELESLVEDSNYGGGDEFVKELVNIIDDSNILNVVRNNSEVSDVSEFIGDDHIARYCIAFFEESCGDGKSYEFLWQMFEMYGPIWSPLSDEYHLDFLAAFEKSDEEIRSIFGFEDLVESYCLCRTEIISRIAQVCLDRRKKWLSGIDKLLEGEK